MSFNIDRKKISNLATNHSPSKMLYSFAKANRFAQNKILWYIK